MPDPKARKLRTPKPKQIAPKAITLIMVTRRKLFGFCISLLIFKAWVFPSNRVTHRAIKLVICKMVDLSLFLGFTKFIESCC